MAERVTLLIAGALVSAVVVASSGRAQVEGPPPPPDAVIEAVEQTPMGPLCWAAIVESIRQIGLRCFPGEHPAAAAELERTSQAMGAMFLERGWTPAQLDSFRRQMGEEGTPTAELCASEDARQMYHGFAKSDPAELRRLTDSMIARPGPPQWGTCL